MNVLFEISVLGYGLGSPVFRTGVHRMTEAWALGLTAKQSPEFQLTFGSFLDSSVCLRSDIFLRGSSAMREVPFEPRSRVRSTLWALEKKLASVQSRTDLHLPGKVHRRLLTRFLSRCHRFLPVDTSAIANHDVFHATYWPFPVRRQDRPPRTRFVMTFVDLINLVRPELSTDGGAFLEGVLDTVASEDFTVCISESTRQDLLQVRPDLNPKTAFVVPLAASASFAPTTSEDLATALKPLGLRAGDYLLSVCTVEKRKNLLRLIDAYEAWSSRQSNSLPLVLTGAGGTALAEVQKRISERGLTDRVRLLGYVPDSVLVSLYQGARVFLYPSLYEGFGLPVLEALQSGAIVVTSNTSSLPEVGGEAAMYCHPGDTDSIVEALQRASQLDGVERDRRVQSGLRHAASFSWQRSVDLLMAIYKA